MSMFSVEQLRDHRWRNLQEWEDGPAYALSQMFSPPAIAIAGGLLVAATVRTAPAWAWAAAYVGGAVFIPLASVLLLLHYGVVTDLHLPSRQERLWPNVMTMAAAWVVWTAMAALIPAVAWSRVHLGRHTLAQPLAGMGVGGGVASVCLWLAG